MKNILVCAISAVLLLGMPSQLFGQAEDDVVINEFTVNPSTGKEYIELLVVASSVNLQAWTLSDVGTRVGATSATEGDITFPPSATYLASVPRGTYIVVELTTPVANSSTLSEDTSLTDASPRQLIIKTTTTGVVAGGTADMSTNENIHLYAGTRAAGTLIDEVLAGTNTSYITGATWGDNNGATNTDNVNGGASLSSGSGVRFVPSDQTSPSGFQNNDNGTTFTVDASSYGTPGTVNTGVNDGGGALPVQLASFSGIVVDNNDVKLEWTTVSEVNNYGFYIERRNESDQTFSVVSPLIEGSGTTLEAKQYSWSDADVAAGLYDYRLRQVDLDGLEHYSSSIKVQVGEILDVSDENRRYAFRLEQNYPNPFNPSTLINYELSVAGYVTLKVYNILGEEIVTLVSSMQEPGNYNAEWDASAMSAGMYIYRLQTGTQTIVKKMMLIK